MTELEKIQKKLKEEEEKQLQERMKNGDIQLVLFESPKLPFFSQGLIEKTIFLPNSSRKKSYELARNDKYSITIGKVGNEEFGTLKIHHRNVMYALLRLWGQNGWKVSDGKGYVDTTRHEILALILKNRPGKNDYASLEKTLWHLKTIPIRIYNLGENKSEELFSLLSDFTISTRNTQEVHVTFNKDITKNYYKKEELKLHYLEIIKKFKSEVASILYFIIDKNLTYMDEYTIKVSALCEQTGLTKYSYNSEYRKTWKKALEELNNAELPSGKKTKVLLKENKQKELIFSAKLIKNTHLL